MAGWLLALVGPSTLNANATSGAAVVSQQPVAGLMPWNAACYIDAMRPSRCARI